MKHPIKNKWNFIILYLVHQICKYIRISYKSLIVFGDFNLKICAVVFCQNYAFDLISPSTWVLIFFLRTDSYRCFNTLIYQTVYYFIVSLKLTRRPKEIYSVTMVTLVPITQRHFIMLLCFAAHTVYVLFTWFSCDILFGPIRTEALCNRAFVLTHARK